MAQTYELADVGTEKLLAEVRKRHHPILEKCSVTVAVLHVADIDAETGEVHRTLKAHGYPAAAEIKITPLKQRVLGVADAVVVLDQAAWDDMSREERRSVLDHELCHLQVKAIERGLVGMLDAVRTSAPPARDDHGRPVLKMRQHDWQLGGFREIAKRHGAQAIEVQEVQACRDRAGQYFWDFAVKASEAEQAVDEFMDHCQRTANETGTTVTIETQGESVTVAEPEAR